MGNAGSNRSNSRRRHGGESSTADNHHTYDDHRQHPEPEVTNQYIYAAAYTSQNPDHHPPHAPYLQYQTGTRYPPPQLPTVPFQSPRDDPDSELFQDRNFSCTYTVQLPTAYVDHQKALTIRYDVNLKKETFKIEADEENPGKFLVSFTFDATVSCSITLHFFANCNLTTNEEHSLPPITVRFQQGLGQKFRQICKGNPTRLAVMAEARKEDRNLDFGVTTTSQMTDAVFENDKGEYKVKEVKQILWVNGIKYELHEIYGIGNSVDGDDYDGKECVVCLSEPRDTTVLPCRHMCMCNGCAKVLRLQTNRCPICRKTVEMLLEMKFNSGAEDQESYFMPHH